MCSPPVLTRLISIVLYFCARRCRRAYIIKWLEEGLDYMKAKLTVLFLISAATSCAMAQSTPYASPIQNRPALVMRLLKSVPNASKSSTLLTPDALPADMSSPPPEKKKHDTTATSQGILSDQISVEEYQVEDVIFSVHTKKDADFDAPPIHAGAVQESAWGTYVSEWVCFEHQGFARKKAEVWWKQHSDDPVPATSADAVKICQDDGIAETLSVSVKSIPGQKYDQITSYTLGPKPVSMSAPEPEYVPAADDDIPF